MTSVQAKSHSPSISNRRVPLTTNIVEFKVGLFRSRSGTGRTIQSLGTYVLPGDSSSIRHPISSSLRSALFPGGGGDSRLGRAIGNAAQRVRCPSGSEFGGRFANADLSNCGRQLFEEVGNAVASAARAVGSTASGSVPGVPGSPNAPRGVVRTIDGRVIPMRAVQISRNASIPKVGALRSAQRESAIGAAAGEVASDAKESVRLVRRDGVQLRPVVALDILRTISKNDDMQDGAIVSNIKDPTKIGNSQIPILLNTPISSAVFAMGNGATFRVDKNRPLTIGERRKLSTAWESLKNADDFDYTSRLSQLVNQSNALTFSSRFAGMEKPMERLSVQNADGQMRNVPRWVYEFYLAANAPYRANRTAWQVVVAPGAQPNKINKTPQKTPGKKSLNFEQPSILDGRLSRISQDSWNNSIDFKTASFLNETNYAGYVFEVKRAAAVWDPDLPPSGGFRCPPGTRYGGRISDRFGRNCGYGISRRIAAGAEALGRNIGESLDDRRDRRVAARTARVQRRIGRQEGRVERAQARLERLRGQVAAPGVAGAADRAGMATRLERFADRVDGGAGRKRRQRRGPGLATRLEDFADRVDGGYGRDRNRRVRRRQRQRQGPGAATRLEQFADRVDGGYGRDRKRRKRRERRGPGLATRLDNLADRVDFGYGRDRNRRDGTRVPSRPGQGRRPGGGRGVVEPGRVLPGGMRPRPGQGGRPGGRPGVPWFPDQGMRPRPGQGDLPGGGQGIMPFPDQGMRDDLRPRPDRPGGRPRPEPQRPTLDPDRYPPQGRERPIVPSNKPNMPENVRKAWREQDKDRRKERLNEMSWAELRDYEARIKYEREIAERGDGDQALIADLDVRRNELANERRKRLRERRNAEGQREPGQRPQPAPQRPSEQQVAPAPRPAPAVPQAQRDADGNWPEPRGLSGGGNLPEDVKKVWRQTDADERKNALKDMSDEDIETYRQRLIYEEDLALRTSNDDDRAQQVAVMQQRKREIQSERRRRARNGNQNRGGRPAQQEAEPSAIVKDILDSDNPIRRGNLLMFISNEDLDDYSRRVDAMPPGMDRSIRQDEIVARRVRRRQPMAPIDNAPQDERDARNAYLQPEIEAVANALNADRRADELKKLDSSDLSKYERYVSALPKGADRNRRLAEVKREKDYRALPDDVKDILDIRNSDQRRLALADMSERSIGRYSEYVNGMEDSPERARRIDEFRAELARRKPGTRATSPSAELAPGTPAPNRPNQQLPEAAQNILDMASPDARRIALADLSDRDLEAYTDYIRNSMDPADPSRGVRLREIGDNNQQRRNNAQGRNVTPAPAAPAAPQAGRRPAKKVPVKKVPAAPAGRARPRADLINEQDADKRKEMLAEMPDEDMDALDRFLGKIDGNLSNVQDQRDIATRREEIAAERARRAAPAPEPAGPGTETRGRAQAVQQLNPALKARRDLILREDPGLREIAEDKINDFDEFRSAINGLDSRQINNIKELLRLQGDDEFVDVVNKEIDKREEFSGKAQRLIDPDNNQQFQFLEIFGDRNFTQETRDNAFRALSEEDKIDIMDAIATLSDSDLDKYKHQVNHLSQLFGQGPTPAAPAKAPAKRAALRNAVRIVTGKREKKRKPDSGLVAEKENDEKLGDIGKDGLPDIKNVPVGNAGITSQAKATKHLHDGGDIRDVPDKYLFKAMSAASRDGNGKPARFSKTRMVGRSVNGGPGNQFMFKDVATGKQYITKYVKYSWAKDEDVHEIVGNNLAGRLGFPVGEFRFASDNRVPEARVRGAVRGFLGRNPEGAKGRAILMENSSNYVNGLLLNPDFIPATRVEAKDRLRATALDYLMLNVDRHGGNYFLVQGNGKYKFVPIDPSLGFNPIVDDDGGSFQNPDGSPSAMEGIDNFKKWLASGRGGRRNEFVSSLREDIQQRRLSRNEVIDELRAIQDTLRKSQEARPLQEFADAAMQAAGDGRTNTRVTQQFIVRHDAFLALTPEELADALIP